MHEIRLFPPAFVGPQTILFRWSVEPATPLYRITEFNLTFPDGIDLAKVPKRLWWDILLLCLHQHWVLLRPCRIHLPLRLSAPERLFWIELLRSAVETLEMHGPRPHRASVLDIHFANGELDEAQKRVTGTGYATSFSSGKDSLLQAAMLCELVKRPLLVTTTSPLPPLFDHLTARRAYIFNQIQCRREVAFVEVISTFRSIWDNGFAAKLGYPLAVNELTDTFLYMSSLLAAASALGRTHLFLASEAEVQESALIGGRIVQHAHFMYSAATQRALAEYLAPYGITFGSLIWPLYSMQVQQLLWARYPDICDLQYSCWRVGEGESTCSQCEQCFRIGMTALASGYDPQRMGIDLVKMLAFADGWREAAAQISARPALPDRVAAERSNQRVLAAVRRTSLLHIARLLAATRPSEIISRRNLDVLREFCRFKRGVKEPAPPPSMGAREAFFEWLDPELRKAVVAIYEQHFPKEPTFQHIGAFLRSEMVAHRAISALART